MSIEMDTGDDGVSMARVHARPEADDLSPAHGFSLVKVVYERSPAEAQTLVARYDSAAEVVIPRGTPKVGYVVYDAAGNTYSREEFERQTPGEPVDPVSPTDRDQSP